MLNFKKLQLEDKERIDIFTKQFQPYSDFNFTSLWSYDIENDCEIYLDSEKMIIKLRDYMTNFPTFSFLTSEDPTELISTLFQIEKTLGLKKQLNLVPEISISNTRLNKNQFNITEDRDGFDYVLITENVTNLKGNKYEHQRWRINQFNKNYPNYVIKTSDSTSENEQKQITTLFDKWALKKKTMNSEVDTEHEKKAINRLLANASYLSVINLSIWIEDKMIGFSIFEKINEFAIGHFMKADTEYKGIFEMLYYQSAKHAQLMGCKYLNYEQDLGINDLRKAKLEWGPDFFLKKYIIT